MAFGIHIHKGNTTVCDNIIKYDNVFPGDINAIQVFTFGPRSYRKNKIQYDKLKELTKNRHLYIHSSYYSNIWNGKPQCFTTTLSEFKSAVELNAKGVVLHIPKIDPESVVKGVLKLISSLKKRRGNVLILLEMKAMAASSLSYESPEKIDNLIELMKKSGINKKSVGIVIDTAHIYSGKSDIRLYASAKRYLDSIKNKSWIKLIHLNGNQYSNEKKARDKHAIPLDSKDKIWSNIEYKDSGCKAFIDYSKSNKIPFILEIKSEHTIKGVKNFIDKAFTS